MQSSTARSEEGSQREQPGNLAGPWIRFWTDPFACDQAEAIERWGAKGVSLSRLHQAGLNVPASFTVSTLAGRLYHERGRNWPAGLWPAVEDSVRKLEQLTGRRLGDLDRPLTVAVRSGAARSMPGLLATFLHCGLTEAIARQVDDGPTWQALAVFLNGYAPVLLGREGTERDRMRDATDSSPRSRCEFWLQELANSSAGPLPNDPWLILQGAIRAVMDAGERPAAREWRNLGLGAGGNGTAVTIQAMYPSEISGVVFSQAPAALNKGNSLIVEATRGLGHELLRGQSTPVRWTVDRELLSIQPPRPGSDSSWSDWQAEFAADRLPELCRAALRMEAEFGAPVDMEFGSSAEGLIFFQVRPAAEARMLDEAFVRADVRDRVQRLALGGQTLWVQHPLSDTLACPTPLTWELWHEFMTGHGGYGRLHRQLGFRPSARIDREGFLQLFGGTIYADPDRMVEMYCPGYPLRYDVRPLEHESSDKSAPFQGMGSGPRTATDALRSGPTQLPWEKLDPWFLLRWPIIAWTIFRSRRRQRRLMCSAGESFDRSVVPQVRQWVQSERQVGLESLSLRQLIEVFQRRRRKIFRDIAPETLLPGALGAIAWSSLGQQLTNLLGEVDGSRLQNELLSTVTCPTTDRQQTLLRQVAENPAALTDFLQEFGHRGPGEYELSSPRWRSDLDRLRKSVRQLSHHTARTSTKPTRSAVDPSLVAALEQAGASCLADDVLDTWNHAHRLLPYRETGRNEFLKAYELLHDVLTEIGRKSGLELGVHYLHIDELNSLVTNQRQWMERITERQQTRRICRRIHWPAILDAKRVFDETDVARKTGASDALRAISATPLSSGRATGLAVFVDHSDHLIDVAPGSIVVARWMDPGWLILLSHCAGIVVEQGGSLSHVGILARQLGIPAVVCEQATRLIAAGQTVAVDASVGRIELGAPGMTGSLTLLCQQLGDVLFGWVLIMPRDLAVAAVGILVAVSLLAIRVGTVDRRKLQQVRRDQRRLRELRKQAVARGDHELRNRAARVRSLVASRQLRLESGMLAASVLLSAVVASWGADRFQFLPIRGGESVRFAARFPASFAGQLAHVVPMNGVEAEGGWVQRIEGGFVHHQPAGIAEWTLRFDADRTHCWLVTRSGNDSAVHPATVNTNHYEPPVRMHRGGLQTELALTPYRPLGVVPARIFPGLPGWSVWLALVAGCVYWLGTVIIRR